jgi:putative aldouronate transport system substrate-binding protein
MHASQGARIAATKFLDYMYTPEGQNRDVFGAEGVEWRKPETGEKALEQGVTPTLTRILPEAGAAPLIRSGTHWHSSLSQRSCVIAS